MTKLITVTGRAGAGKTTIAAIIAERLSERHTVCLIDNNNNNMNIYSASASIENINLYSCLSDKESCCRAIKESATEVKKNLYFFSGSHDLLTEEQMQLLKEQDIFDYIIMDSMVEVSDDISDINVIVVNQNTLEFNAAAYHRITGSNKIIVINRYAENSEFKMKKEFKLFFCPEIIDFANGFKLVLPEENEKEIERIIEKITGDKSVVKAKKKFKLF